MTRTRRIILIVVLAFVLYSIVTNPEQSAHFVQEVFQWLANAVQSIFDFFGALLR